MKSSLIERIGLQHRPLLAFTALIGLAALLTCLAPRASVPILLLAGYALTSLYLLLAVRFAGDQRLHDSAPS